MARSRRGQTQFTAARSLGCSERSYKAWETSRRKPLAFWLPKISQFVDLSEHKTFELWKQQ